VAGARISSFRNYLFSRLIRGDLVGGPGIK